jgi:hypothetical protein
MQLDFAMFTCWKLIKDETVYYIQIYKAEFEKQLVTKIKHLRSDHGGE